MNKLSFEDLKNLAETVATNDLLEQVSGGNLNDCHDSSAVTFSVGTWEPSFPMTLPTVGPMQCDNA